MDVSICGNSTRYSLGVWSGNGCGRGLARLDHLYCICRWVSMDAAAKSNPHYPPTLPHLVRLFSASHFPPIGCVRVLTGNGNRMTQHCLRLRHISSDPNPLEYTNEYVEGPIQTNLIGVFNEAVIGVK